MSLLNWIRNRVKGQENDQEIVDAGLCPNCWGSQEYDGKFVKAIKDKQIDIIILIIFFPILSCR